jgi:uncharacterized membrane protein
LTARCGRWLVSPSVPYPDTWPERSANMTTPEDFRRRQRIEGTILLILGLWVAYWTYDNSQRDQEIIACLETKVNELSVAAGARADIVERETSANKKVLLSVPQVKTEKAFSKLLHDYKVTIENIQEDRRENPMPPYPKGTCD